jgi:hypothetical protein
VTAGPGVERQKRPPLRRRDLLQRHHQRPRNPSTPRVRVNEQLHDFAAVPLIGGRRQIQLHRAEDVPVEPGDENTPGAGADVWQHLSDPERPGVLARERDDEAHAGAVIHDRMEQIGKRIDIALARRGLGGVGPPLLNMYIRRWCRSRHGWMMATRYRASRLPVPWNRDGPLSL